MAKENNSSAPSTPTKAASKGKQSTSRKTASQNRLHVVGTALTDAPSGAMAQRTEPSAADLDQEIRLRAYQIYCDRGGFDGAHEDDWHRAEQDVHQKNGKFKYGT